MRPALMGALVAGAMALQSPASADVKAGVDAWQQGDYARAVAEWRPLAESGDADAMFNLAQAYKLGRGVPQSASTALNWYREAALKGHGRAEDNYGLLLFQQGKREDAMPYIRRSADRGEPRAQYILGTALFNGDYAPKDWVMAYALMTRAAAAGLDQASASLTSMDKYIPEDQRKKGLAIAAQMAAVKAAPKEWADPSASGAATPPKKSEWTQVPPQPRSAPTPRIVPQPSVAPPQRLATADLPPSKVPPAPAAASAAPIAPAAPVIASEPVAAPPPAASLPKPEVRPAPRSKPSSALLADGRWRAQFGAFRDEGNAKRLWETLRSSFAELSDAKPYLVRGTAITRLQAGGFATQADAAKFCGKVRAKGFDCLVMRRD